MLKNIPLRSTMKPICLFFFFALSGVLADPKKLINIDFIGRGYDIYYGNPQTDRTDPGFKDAVVAITYNSVRNSNYCKG
jgi:hypothetical protein